MDAIVQTNNMIAMYPLMLKNARLILDKSVGDTNQCSYIKRAAPNKQPI